MKLTNECKHEFYIKADEDVNHAVDRTESHYVCSLITFCIKCKREWSSWKGEIPDELRNVPYVSDNK